MNENKQLMKLIDEAEFEKAILKELVNKFSDRFDRYIKIIKAHPGYVESLDPRKLPVDERIYVQFCDILVDLEISFLKFKIQDFVSALEHIDLLKRQLVILEKEMNNELPEADDPCEQIL